MNIEYAIGELAGILCKKLDEINKTLKEIREVLQK